MKRIRIKMTRKMKTIIVMITVLQRAERDDDDVTKTIVRVNKAGAGLKKEIMRE
jgi:hypothetical protein